MGNVWLWLISGQSPLLFQITSVSDTEIHIKYLVEEPDWDSSHYFPVGGEYNKLLSTDKRAGFYDEMKNVFILLSPELAKFMLNISPILVDVWTKSETSPLIGIKEDNSSVFDLLNEI